MPAAPNQIPAPPPSTPLFVNGAMNQSWYTFFQQLASNVLQLQSAFTNFTDFTPAVSASGGMTISGETIQDARYQQYGNVISIYAAVTFTTGGTASPDVLMSLPISSSSDGLLSASVMDGGQIVGEASIVSGELSISRYDGANWGIGTARGFVVSGTYRAA